MKRLVSIVLSMVMILSILPVMAATDTQPIENALVVVKGKVTIPEEYSEFDMGCYDSSYMGDGSYYRYEWYDKERTKGIEVDTTTGGMVIRYFHHNVQYNDVKSDISVSEDEAFKVGDAFIRKALPECFSNSDDLYVRVKNQSDDLRFNGDKLEYTFTYERMHKGNTVYNNTATVSVMVVGSECIVSGLGSGWDYNAVFNDLSGEYIQNPEDVYSQKFPIEMIYRDKYYYYKINDQKDSNTPDLIYRYKDNTAGYILADSGEIFIPYDKPGILNNKFESDMSADSVTSAGSGSNRENLLTQEEIKKLEEISTLISDKDAENIIRNNKYINLGEEYKLESSELFKYSQNDERYNRTVRLGYNTENRSGSVYAKLDATTGKIESFSHSVNGKDVWSREVELTDSLREKGNSVMQGFLEENSADELKEYKLTNEAEYTSRMEREYTRYIDSVKYINNTISVSYDFRDEYLARYYITYTKDFENLPKVSDAITMDAAIGKMFEIHPLSLVYMPGEESYSLCYASHGASGCEIDAISSEQYVYGRSRDVNLIPYTDIENHWVKKSAEDLMNVGIGFDDGLLKPDAECTQVDLLRIFMSGINKSTSYMRYTDENIYSIATSRGYITEEEKNPEAKVTREDAFVIMIKIMNYEKIADLKGIFKTDFLDNQDISSEKIGYAAILYGMGIISGDGSNIRPKEMITRAEVLTLAYRCII